MVGHMQSKVSHEFIDLDTMNAPLRVEKNNETRVADSIMKKTPSNSRRPPERNNALFENKKHLS